MYLMRMKFPHKDSVIHNEIYPYFKVLLRKNNLSKLCFCGKYGFSTILFVMRRAFAAGTGFFN